MSWPKVLIDQQKLLDNLDLLADLCHSRGMTMAAVGKGAAAHPAVMAAVEASRADLVADARLDNLERTVTAKPKLLLRIVMPSTVERVIRACDISANSEIATVRLLGEEARRQGRRHKILLMTDLGDLREGVFFRNREGLLALADTVMAQEWLDLYGLGVNLSCFGGVMPSAENMGVLIELAALLREHCGVELPLVSGGATSNLPTVLAGAYPLGPGGVTNLRLGEAWLLGSDSSGDQWVDTLPGLEAMHTDTMILETELIEVQTKPSRPLGHIGCNAFGEAVEFADEGEMRRGVCALGRQDAKLDGLLPLDGRVRVLGGSSDHTILDLTAAPEYRVGDRLRFRMTYGCMLQAFTSPYVDKQISRALPG
ncbi:MAG: alanine racemase [Firmicutes bacterium]|nr:alanine racemase [Bacillota bacterium]